MKRAEGEGVVPGEAGAPVLGRGERVLVLAPHPDDESLAAGGLLQQAIAAGAAARVLFATDGENDPWKQRLIDRRWHIGQGERARFGVRRRAEAGAALAALGLGEESAIFLGLPDQGLTGLLVSGGALALERMSGVIGSFRPTLLVTPSLEDLHPDHSALAVLARLALARPAAGPGEPRVLTYLVHGRRTAGPESAPLHLPLTAAQRDRKRAAILQYPTQLAVHRRRFLSFADGEEAYWPTGRPTEGDDRHPVRLAVVEEGEMRLEVALQPRPAAWGRPTLRLLADRDDGGCEAFAIDLDWRVGSAPIRRSSTGPAGAAVGEARLEGRRRRGVVAIPLAALPAADRQFVKIERRFGFFDEAGWRAIPAGAARTRLAAEAAEVCCIIPCYNVAALCGPVVRAAAEHAGRVIVVDDGSTDDTGTVLRAVAAASGGRVRVLSFDTNRGKGAALLRAFREAMVDPACRIVVTFDGDGQHHPSDLRRLTALCRDGADLVIGERLQLWRMPLASRIGNALARGLLRRLEPRCPIDTQSGFRAHSRAFVKEVLQSVSGKRYETELHVLLLALAQGRRIATVPIPTLYFDGNRMSHYRPFADSFRIGAAILEWYLPVFHAGR